MLLIQFGSIVGRSIPRDLCSILGIVWSVAI